MIILNDIIYPLLDELDRIENEYSIAKIFCSEKFNNLYRTRLYMMYISTFMIIDGKY